MAAGEGQERSRQPETRLDPTNHVPRVLQGAPPVPQGARLLEDTGAASLPPGGAEACSGRRGGGTGHFCPLGIVVLRIWLRPSPEAWGQERGGGPQSCKGLGSPTPPSLDGGGRPREPGLVGGRAGQGEQEAVVTARGQGPSGHELGNHCLVTTETPRKRLMDRKWSPPIRAQASP